MENLTLEELIEAVEHQTLHATDLDRITVAESMSYDLGRLADQLTDHFVQAARVSGHSWSEIGKQLGMSKQGAQQRYVVPADDANAAVISQMIEMDIPPQGDPQRAGAVRQTLKRVKEALHFQRFDDHARMVVIGAQGEAHKLKHAYIGGEHLLLSILTLGPNETATKALAAAGVELGAAAERIRQELGTGTTDVTGHIPFSKEAKKALELSLRESIRLGHNYIGAEHVLLGLVRGEGKASELLEKLGASRDSVIAAVDKGLAA